MKKKKISVIIPAYNAEKYIKSCVNSIISENYPELEIIVVNDGSTDNTESLLLEYGEKIKYIKKENGGVSSARNIGLDNASGDYVMFLDSDDSLPKGVFDSFMELLEKYNADIIRGNYSLFYPNGTHKEQLNPIISEKLIQKAEFKKYIYSYFMSGIRFNTPCASLIKKDLIKHRFRTDMKTGEDSVFMMDVYTNANNALLTDKVFYNYMQTGEGLTGCGLSVIEKYKCNFEISKEIIKRLEAWGMNSFRYKIKSSIRPIILTVDKLKRNLLK